MSLQLINDYLAELDRLKKISGSRRETIVLARVTTVSVRTVAITEAMRNAPR
jgi:hypothetical protein